MNKIKFSILVIVAALLAGNALFAQSVEQGKKFYYYERYKSAKSELEKVVASNPKNMEAIYWLGQTLIDDNDSVAAKNIYQKALAENANSALILAGIGHIELLEGKTNEARQHFESAISISSGKDINVLNAIGKANAQTRNGDARYAIEKLTQATQVRKFNDPFTYLYMGDAYRKLIDGGGAVTAYNKALATATAANAKLAAATYGVGKVYLTQHNTDYFLPAFEEAVQMDPDYAPAYYELFDYWYNLDINKAASYFDKYLAVSDPTPNSEYDRISIIFARRAYQDAITAAKQKIAAEPSADPRYYKLIAYSYDELKDSVNAKNYLDQYFSKQKPEGFVAKDYSFRGSLLAKIPGADSSETFKYYQMAIDKDTAVQEKMKMLREAVDVAKRKNNKVATARFAGQLYALNSNPVNTDLYNWGFANYSAGNYKTADSIFCNIYIPKYPDEIYGYLWCAKSRQAQDDSANTQGLAVDAYKKLGEVARALYSTAKAAGTADSVKYKKQVLDSYFFLAFYYNNVKKDRQMALYYLGQVIEVDPNNPNAPGLIKTLTEAGKRETGASGSKPSGQAAKQPAAKSGAAKK